MYLLSGKSMSSLRSLPPPSPNPCVFISKCHLSEDALVPLTVSERATQPKSAGSGYCFLSHAVKVSWSGGPGGDLQLDCPSFPSLYWVLRDPDLLMLSVLQIFVLPFGSVTEGGILPGFSVNGELQLMLTFPRWFLLDIDRP